MDILKTFVNEARKLKGKIVFAEGDEERALEAAVRLQEDRVCRTVVVSSDGDSVTKAASRKNLKLSGVEVVVPSGDLIDPKVRNAFLKGRVLRGYSKKEAEKMVLEPLYFSALFVKSGAGDALVAGARSDTADLIRAAIYGIGTSPGTKIVSSFFLMIPPENHPVVGKPIIFSDCAVNPGPTASELKDIAVSSIGSFKRLFPGITSRTAFLSFSTKGSA